MNLSALDSGQVACLLAIAILAGGYILILLILAVYDIAMAIIRREK